MDDERLARLIDAGQQLAGQTLTFAIQHHVKQDHSGGFDDCGIGSCRSSRFNLWKWEQAAGDEGHNWIAAQGRKD